MHTGGIKIPVSKKKDRIVPPRVGHTLRGGSPPEQAVVRLTFRLFYGIVTD